MDIHQTEKDRTKGGCHMKFSIIANQLIEKLDAIQAELCDCNLYLNHDEKLISGFFLRNASLNYKLLTEYDLLSLSEDQRKLCCRWRISPFDDMLLIFFTNEKNEISFKIINGMGSRLIIDLYDICKKIELD